MQYGLQNFHEQRVYEMNMGFSLTSGARFAPKLWGRKNN